MSRTERLVLSIAVLSSFVVFLDTSVINVALPAISEDLGGGLGTQQWVVDAYLITLGSLILLAGSLSDLFGRISILRARLIGFGLSSVIIAVAPTAELMILMRGVQGVAGALLVPSSLAIIMSTFRGGDQARAIGSWTAWTSAAFLAGPVLGGAFVEFLSWRLVFAINIVPIVVTLWLLVALGQRDVRKPDAHVDVPGAILGIVGLGGPVFALIEQAHWGWTSPVILVPLVVGVLSLVAFLWWQRRAPAPMLPLGLFHERNFSVGNLATALIYAALSISGFIVVIYLQEVAGFSPTVAALAFLPVSLGNVLLSRVFGGLSARFGPRFFMTVGPLLAGVGHLLFLSIGTDVDYVAQVLPGVLLFAVGISMTVAPLTSAILGSIPVAQSGIASAVNNAVARIAGLIAIAMLGVIVASTLDVGSFHQVILVIAGLFVAGGLVSFVGIRNPTRAATGASEDDG